MFLLLFYCCFIAVLLLFYCCFIAVLLLARPLLAPYVFNGRFSRRSRRSRRRMQQSCIFRRQKTVSANVSAKADAADNAEKDSYHIVECCLLFIQQICKGTRLLFFARSLPFPCSFVSCSFFVRSLFVPYVFNGRSHGNKGN